MHPVHYVHLGQQLHPLHQVLSCSRCLRCLRCIICPSCVRWRISWIFLNPATGEYCAKRTERERKQEAVLPLSLSIGGSSFSSALYSVHSLHSATLYIALQHSTVCNTLHCTIYTVQSTLYTLHCTLYIVHSSQCTQFALYTLKHSRLYTLHSTLSSIHICSTSTGSAMFSHTPVPLCYYCVNLISNINWYSIG